MGDDAVVAIILLIQERQRNKRPAPLRRLQERRSPRTLEDTEVGSNLGQSTVLRLCIGNVLHGLLYHRLAVVVADESLAIQPVLFQPTQLLPVRTVCPYRLPVAADGSVYQHVGIGKEIIATLKVACLAGRVVYEAGIDILQHLHVALHLQVAIAIVTESRMPVLPRLTC